MKFFFFHLMPYAYLDPDYDKNYVTDWLLYPNSNYDPEKGAELYNRYLDEIEYADALGFDGVCVNEHHQTAYGLMPTPGVLAGALSRRTKTVKIAVLGRALPLLNNPLTVAEEYAILDNITRGRLVAGFVRGIGVEYHASG
ncbi:MAG: LLM class flavin-dependent oxidoreductase, partial [Alphaproteobacteria bacterium]|nr:LLM class flavin-dependent oxidoreductase [Alphaproteobacteria bacterium]